ncbi:aldehyde dehydrogenase family protein, partial [Clostridioides difficile]
IQYYGTNIRDNKDYGRIVNQHHFNRIKTLIQNEKIIVGGDIDAGKNFISPTLIEVTDLSSPIMQEEIFGPVLPIIKFKS